MDNTCVTNKNWYTMAWALEMVVQKRLDLVRISFLIAGHTKSSPDLVFAKLAQTYNQSDVFCTEDLKQVIAPHAEVVIDGGEIVHDRRANLTKYSKLPGIRSLHDFVFAVSASTGKLVCKVRKLCHTGSYEDASIRVQAGQSESENVIPNATHNYSSLNKLRQLSDTKLSDLRQMSTSFIPRDRHLPFLPLGPIAPFGACAVDDDSTFWCMHVRDVATPTFYLTPTQSHYTMAAVARSCVHTAAAHLPLIALW